MTGNSIVEILASDFLCRESLFACITWQRPAPETQCQLDTTHLKTLVALLSELRLVSSFHSQVSGHLSSPVNPSLFLNIKTNPSRAWSFSLSPSLGVDSIKISVSINHSENVYWISRLNSIAGSSARSGLAPLILNILHVMECDSNCH